MTELEARWNAYYKNSVDVPHHPQTEDAARLNRSGNMTAIDCGCGIGADIYYLANLGYKVHGFDSHPEAVRTCREKFLENSAVSIVQSSFEDYTYPQTGLIVANSSLYFSEPSVFDDTWRKISGALTPGGIFSGHFLGLDDDWNQHSDHTINAFSESDVQDLFSNFRVHHFHEKHEMGKTRVGKTKFWHIYSVVAEKVG
ncbi:class I SAM-dependent methyltransferase [Parasalinivibrio latis]|uniref:class I SAM-dependent methyltransferase n=1 Tax=Parasalinivibrio latis TaxID=2952610 RepID=UPI0030DF8905